MLQRIFLLMLVSQIVLGQLRDNFSGNTLSGIWTGDRDSFFISNGILNSYGPSTTSGNLVLSTPLSSINNIEWTFWVNLKFPPNASNYFRYYLISSSSALSSTSVNGYYIQIGETNQDTIKLYRQNGSTKTKIFSAKRTIQTSPTTNSGNLRVKVARDNLGTWTVSSDFSGGEYYTLDGTIFDNTIATTGFTGVNCAYSTPSRYNLYQIDDISVQQIGFDDIPPRLLSVTALNSSTLLLEFSEPVERSSADDIQNYVWVEGQMAPDSAILSVSGTSVLLTFPSSFPPFTTQQIQVSGIQDVHGNPITVTQSPFSYQPPIPVVEDNFNDGNYTSNPVWTGSSNAWEVANQSLHSTYTTSNAGFYISTPFTRSKASEWELYTHIEFNPSSVNYVDYVLQSDGNNLLATFQNGYFVRMGGSTDEVSLYKKANGTNQLVINGRDNILNTSNNQMKVKVIRDDLFNWALFSDISGTGENYIQEGIVQDSTFNNGTHFGLIVQQSTSSFFSKHTFDQVYAGPVRKDSIPPSLISTILLDEKTLEITFSEKIDTNFVKQSGSIILNGSIIPLQVNITNGSSIILKYGSSFVSGATNSLIINGVKDLAGNQADLSATFIYTKPYQIKYREITINEVYADESPSNGLPDCEYLELYNSLPNPVNLQGFALLDGSIKRVLTRPLTISGNGFALICSSPANAQLLKEFDSNISVYTLSGFSLTNSGESQELLDNQGNRIDKVIYTSSWYQDTEKSAGGWSLEQINPKTPCSNSSNWKASIHSLGGTPGKINSIYSNLPDTTGPSIISAKQISHRSWAFEFSEPLDSSSIRKGAFTISDQIVINSIDSISADLTIVYLSISPNIAPGKIYSMHVNGIKDCLGNPSDTTKFFFGKGRKPKAYELIISELMADETPKIGLPEYEFVEIFNPTNEILSIDSVKICDLSNCTYLPNKIIQPNQYIILSGSSYISNFKPYGEIIGLSNFPSLNNSGDRISIKNPKNEIIHSVKYADTWYGDETKKQGGWSLEMIDPLNPCGSQANWKASVDQNGGTPGKVNSILASNPDFDSPEIISTVLTDSLNVEVQINETVDSVSFRDCIVRISNQNTSLTWKLLSPDFDKINIQLSSPVEFNTIETITLTGIKDCKSNSKVLTGNFVRPSQANTGDVIINEILFNPYPGGADFVEIYNRNSIYTDMYGWQLGNWSNDSVSNLKQLTVNHLILPPNGYLVFTTDTQNIKNNYPRAKSGSLIQMTSMPSYNDDAGTVVLVMPSGIASEQFTYSKDLHFKLLDDVEGVSLERVNPDLPASFSSSWHSAASNVGYATPGFVNSQLTHTNQNNDPFTVSLESITPDGDGDRDFTLLNYQFANPGQVANINVFDAKGRKVRTLAKNELLAVDGNYQWDGTDDSGSKASIGMYLIHAEVFDLQGKSGVYVKKVAVGAKF